MSYEDGHDNFKIGGILVLFILLVIIAKSFKSY